MDPMVKVQHQVRQNADELQDFLRDLNQWKDEMKKKENEIGDIVPTHNPLPPIRGSRGGKSTKISVSSENRRNKAKQMTTEEKSAAKSTAKRIPSYDYGAWDKYDADKACEEVDVHEEENEDPEEEYSDEDEDYELIQKKEAAAESKEKGNDFFRMGKLDQAIECYTQGMLCDPGNPFLPANRALALLKKQMYAAAEQDCNLAIAIDDTYIKAYQRRGTARMAQLKYEEAREDFRRVMDLEPGNRQAYDELVKLRKMDEAAAAQAKTRKSEPLPGAKRIEIIEVSSEEINEIDEDAQKVGLVAPIQKPPHLRSKKPLKRIRIQEVSTKFEEPEQQRTPESAETDGKASSPLICCAAEPSQSINEITDEEELIVPGPPQSLLQLNQSWKMLKKCREKQYQYLQQIPCRNYATIFDDFLESENISEFVNILRDFYMRDGLDFFTPLKELAKVKRFQIQAMFLNSKDRKVIEDLFSNLVDSTNHTEEEIAELAKLYQIKK